MLASIKPNHQAAFRRSSVIVTHTLYNLAIYQPSTSLTWCQTSLLVRPTSSTALSTAFHFWLWKTDVLSWALPDFLGSCRSQPALCCHIQAALLQATIPFRQPDFLSRCLWQVSNLESLLVTIFYHIVPGISTTPYKGKTHLSWLGFPTTHVSKERYVCTYKQLGSSLEAAWKFETLGRSPLSEALQIAQSSHSTSLHLLGLTATAVAHHEKTKKQADVYRSL